jgi:hypothetical protein
METARTAPSFYPSVKRKRRNSQAFGLRLRAPYLYPDRVYSAIAAVNPRSGRYGRYRTYYGPIWFETVIDRHAEAAAVGARSPRITTQHYESDKLPDCAFAVLSAPISAAR